MECRGYFILCAVLCEKVLGLRWRVFRMGLHCRKMEECVVQMGGIVIQG